MYSFSTPVFVHWKPLSLVLLLNDKTENGDLVTKSAKGQSECSEAQVETMVVYTISKASHLIANEF